MKMMVLDIILVSVGLYFISYDVHHKSLIAV